MRFRSFIVAALILALAAGGARAGSPTVRIAVLKYGTVSWLTDTIVENELDSAAGYTLEVVELAGKAATAIAFQSGDVDIIVTDWPWALQQRDRGRNLRFAPYSNALGALMAEADVEGICDLRGRQVGVVGGDRDKSWLVLQALVRTECGFDLAAETSVVVGAAPLISQQLLDGAVDAVSTYWNHAAKLEAQGSRRLIGVAEAMARLGITPAPPLIGFVWNADAIGDDAIGSFLNSVAAAQHLLARSDAEWERLRPQTGAAGEVEFLLLRDQFRAGIVRRWTARDTAAAAKLHDLLIDAGGDAYTAEAGRFDPALFGAPDADGN